MAKYPTNWEEYEHGRSSSYQGSVTSTASAVHFDRSTEADRLVPPDRHDSNGSLDLQRKRHVCLLARMSSISMRINSFTQAGGVNSLENFARSWQRAVAFHEFTPTRASFAITEDGSQPDIRRLRDAERSSVQPRSLLRQQLEHEGRREMAVHDSGEDVQQLPPDAASPRSLSASPNRDTVFPASYRSSAFSASFGGTYGSLSAWTNETTRETASRLFMEQQTTGIQEPDKDVEPMLIRRVQQEDGKMVMEVVGQSTIYQTVLNSTNVLIGVGLLSLPLGIKYAGWLIGLLFLSVSAIVTGYTARLLGKCLTVDRNQITFSDLAYIAFGPRAQFLINASLAIVGLLMFGDMLRDEITANIFVTKGYPKSISYMIAICISIIPLTKIPLK
ncbi:MAG: hypothetical protein LQ340_003218 [Diploschistes diacapsis]|nr:MAG: hypothetical protein LQ340_003218 [Diploschistes diacapsis]